MFVSCVGATTSCDTYRGMYKLGGCGYKEDGKHRELHTAYRRQRRMCIRDRAWTEPIDTTKITDNNPDFWQISGTAGSIPVASYGDTPMSVIGMCEILTETQRFVYLPFIKTGGAFQILNRPMNHLYSRIIGEVSIDSVLGSESVDEAFRVSTINIEEGI